MDFFGWLHRQHRQEIDLTQDVVTTSLRYIPTLAERIVSFTPIERRPAIDVEQSQVATDFIVSYVDAG